MSAISSLRSAIGMKIFGGTALSSSKGRHLSKASQDVNLPVLTSIWGWNKSSNSPFSTIHVDEQQYFAAAATSDLTSW